MRLAVSLFLMGLLLAGPAAAQDPAAAPEAAASAASPQVRLEMAIRHYQLQEWQQAMGALAVTVQGRSGLTPYARTGNWPTAARSVLILLAAALPGSRRRAMSGKPAKIAR